MYLQKQFIKTQDHELGVNEGPILVFGLFLALQQKNSLYLDLIESIEDKTDIVGQKNDNNQDSREVFLRP